MSSRFTEPGGQSRRVRWEPNERLVRYYTTLGLLDRPAELRGRTAYYGDRHLLQLLAIKAQQAQGIPLGEIQATLAGRTDRELQELAGLSEDWREQTLAAPGEMGHEETTSSPPARFWERRAPRLEPPSEPAPPTEADLPLQGFELAPGVILTIDRRLYPTLDPRQLSRLAAPLMQVLHSWNHPKEDEA